MEQTDNTPTTAAHTASGDLQTALARWRDALSPDHVLTDDESLAQFADPYSPVSFGYVTKAVVQPGSVEEVQAVVRIASETGVPIWTNSQGRNNGYGARRVLQGPLRGRTRIGQEALGGHSRPELGQRHRQPPGARQRLHPVLRSPGGPAWRSSSRTVRWCADRYGRDDGQQDLAPVQTRLRPEHGQPFHAVQHGHRHQVGYWLMPWSRRSVRSWSTARSATARCCTARSPSYRAPSGERTSGTRTLRSPVNSPNGSGGRSDARERGTSVSLCTATGRSPSVTSSASGRRSHPSPTSRSSAIPSTLRR
ncbi:FAD-binding oxidoreductase [Streptomyces spongiae]|uniref:FAD-binding oxidoreductase n=1 Tax=Streptomyces spongiae TaxID=565072 RepID=A0A5N8X8F7_9ACTN|nr:FAD-binding oxidoreductase [Streptomyces spongiae]